MFCGGGGFIITLEIQIRLDQHREVFDGGLQSGEKHTQCSYSFSIKQKDAEGVIVVVVVAEEAARAQADGHHVPGLQVEGHHGGGAVLLILRVLLTLLRQHQAVDLQSSAGGQRGVGGAGVAVDGEGQTVDPRAGNGEGAAVLVVAVPQVEEDVFVDDILAGGEGAQAFEAVVGVQRNRGGDGAGWRQRCKKSFNLSVADIVFSCRL